MHLPPIYMVSAGDRIYNSLAGGPPGHPNRREITGATARPLTRLDASLGEIHKIISPTFH